MSHVRALLRSVWLWPALAMLLVGLLRATGPELWRDEISSWSAATRDLGRLFGMLANVDASNGAYYVLLHFWTELFGDSVLSLRLPSALAMAGAAACTALTARRLFGSRTAGLAAGLLLATVPLVSRFAQEVRAYALVTCAVAAASWLLLRALERPTVGRWALYALALAVAGCCHLVSLSSLAGQLVLVLAHGWGHRRERGAARVLWQFPLAVLAALLPTVPVAVYGDRQSARQLGWLPTPSVHDLLYFWHNLLYPPREMYAFAALGLLALLHPRFTRGAVQALLLGVLPVLVVWQASQGTASYFTERYLLFTVPALAALAGGGVAAVAELLGRLTTRPLALTAALALIAVPLVLGAPRQLQQRALLAHADRDYAGAAALIAAGYRPGDGIVATGGDQAWAMVGPGISFYLPRSVRPAPMFVERDATRADDLYAVPCPVAQPCVGHAPRTWVVTIGTGENPYEGLPGDQTEALQHAFVPTAIRRLPGLTVSLLVRKA
ncbi:mannosyltransferase [Kitasatospora gansuensis]|uniref:Mannosyltransferase n=1 Tax=Kitasatospora gansuensis TaxID=258050 RepID=A0A7W7SBF2_9ACTN|nr:glycosyltransferase family 39 protein [Kitasatospora gansuensis]MBB4947364.1 mannosyltransferase [Kitasatospora gansuensis]